MLTFGFYTGLVLFILVCLLLMLLILIQKGRGGGLASAFGGAGGNTAFGSKTGDVLTWATSIVFGVFLLLAVVLNLMSNEMDRRSRAAVTTEVVQPLPQQPLPGMPPIPGMPPAGVDVEAPAAAPAGAPAPAPTTAPAQ
jgi:preprotein translocase subunit SecG